MKLMKLAKMSVLVLLLMLFTAFLIAQQVCAADSCDCAWATGSATADGSTLHAQNPDDCINMIFVPFYVPHEKHPSGTVRQLSSGDHIPQVEETYAVIGLSFQGGAHGVLPEGYNKDFYWATNEYGVTLANTAIPSVKYTDGEGTFGYWEKTTQGMPYRVIEGAPTMSLYDTVGIVCERAKTAEEAVKIYGELIESYNCGGIGWPGPTHWIVSGPEGEDKAWELELDPCGHEWAARPIKVDMFTGSNAPMLGNDFTIGSPGAEKYWVGEPRLTPGRAYSTRTPLEAAFGHITPELMMRIMSSRKGDRVVPDFDPAITTKENVNCGWVSDASAVAQYRPDYPELLRSRVYMSNNNPGVGQPSGSVYVPFYVSAKKPSIPAEASDINIWWANRLFQTIPGDEILKYQHYVFAAQDEMEEKALNLIEEGKEDEALELVNQFEKDMLDKALKLSEKHFKPLIPLRINVGGPEYVDSSGNVWKEDQEADIFNSKDLALYGCSGGTKVATSKSIANSDDDVIYQTGRIGRNFTYKMQLPEGKYQVTLKFAEIEGISRGMRLFNVTLNRDEDGFAAGNLVLNLFDVAGAAGGDYASVDKTYPVAVYQLKKPYRKPTGETMALKIDLSGYESDAILCGIEVIQTDTIEPPTWEQPIDCPNRPCSAYE